MSLLNLKMVYLQVHVDKAMWPFQTGLFKGQIYCFTWLGFGLNMIHLLIRSIIELVSIGQTGRWN